MELLNNKSFEEISEQTYAAMTQEGFSTTPGAICRLFADIINKNISEFYNTLKINHVQAFVTTASGKFLEAIGILLDCTRKPQENDSDYKKRITSQCLTLARANETAIRLAVLSIDGVLDVKMKRYSNGPGSFTIIPIVDASVDDSILDVINEIVSSVSSYGEKIIIKLPELKYVKLTINLIYSTNLTDTDKQSLAIAVRENVIKYINSIPIGQPFIVNQLTESIMQSDNDSSSNYNSNIISYSCNSFKINEEECLFINQGARWDEKYQVSIDTNAIIVQ